MQGYNSIFDRFSKFIEKLDIFRPIQNGIGQKVIDNSLAGQIYGSPSAFLDRMKDFEEIYFQKLSDPRNIRRSKLSSVNADVMRQTRDIDLSVFNVNVRRELESVLQGDIVRTTDLFANAGFPSLSFPSSSPFRMPFKFEVDQGLEHPAQVMLNRLIFNIDPMSTSAADVKFGTTNFMSASDMERNMEQIASMRQGKLLQFGQKDNGAMKRVITFDVETTGLGSSSQVRSVALMERTGLASKPQTVYKFGYDSPQLGGTLAGPGLSDTLSDFISKGEKLGTTVKTEDEFLSNMKQVMKRLNEADQVTGHNVGFDINQMIRTMSGMSGYHKDDELKGLVDTFLKRKETDKAFVVDTLEIGRAYITDKAQAKINAGGLPLERGREYIEKFFSTQSLADVTMGGKATYVGVENFAMNTNLLDLMAQEEYAPEIFGNIFAGSHIAETDTILQDHIAKYIHTGKLDILDSTTAVNPETAELLRIARKTIFKSSATTAVTNIADPKLLTETALGYVKGEGLTGVRATISIQEAINEGLVTSQVGSAISAEEGFIKYDKGTYKLFTGTQSAIEIQNQENAKRYLINTIEQARSGNDASVTFRGANYSFNAAEKKIQSLGITFGQNSSIGAMERTLGITVGEMNPQNYVENVGNLFKNFAEAPNKFQLRNIRRGAESARSAYEANFNFAPGLNLGREGAVNTMGKLVAHAEAALGSGNKFGFLGVRESVFSTMFASTTSSLATDLYNKAVNGSIDEATGKMIRNKFAYAASSEIADITSQLGIGHVVKQGDFVLTGQNGPAKKMLVSYEYFKNLQTQEGLTMAQQIAENKVAVSLSVATRGNLGDEYQIINAVWKSGRDESGLTARRLAETMYEDFVSGDGYKKMINANSSELETEVQTFKQMFSGLDREQAIKSIQESIDERGIGIGFFGTKETAESVDALTEGLAKAGVDLTNEQSSYMMRISGETSDVLQLSHAYDQTVLEASGEVGRNRLIGAIRSVIGQGEEGGDAAKLGKALLENESLKRTALHNLKTGRGQTGISSAVEMYHAYKGKVGLAALGVTALAAGYYIGKRKKENNLYDETLREQPRESFRQNDARNNYTSSMTSLNSSRRDPLVTAGVVGDLDNRKIGHTQMGNNKYNYLYGR